MILTDTLSSLTISDFISELYNILHNFFKNYNMMGLTDEMVEFLKPK